LPAVMAGQSRLHQAIGEAANSLLFGRCPRIALHWFALFAAAQTTWPAPGHRVQCKQSISRRGLRKGPRPWPLPALGVATVLRPSLDPTPPRTQPTGAPTVKSESRGVKA